MVEKTESVMIGFGGGEVEGDEDGSREPLLDGPAERSLDGFPWIVGWREGTVNEVNTEDTRKRMPARLRREKCSVCAKRLKRYVCRSRMARVSCARKVAFPESRTSPWQIVSFVFLSI